MIIGTQACLRYSEPDDVSFLFRLYLDGGPRAALLDTRRERMQPTMQELRDLLEQKDAARGLLYTVEDEDGRIQGWCGVRGVNYEARFAEIALIFEEQERYASPMADEALAFVLDRAFGQLGLRKVMILCLDCEPALRGCLLRAGFVSCGVQRQALYSGGVWHDMETLTRAVAPPATA